MRLISFATVKLCGEGLGVTRASRVRWVVIRVPENLKIPPDELEERLRIELALRLYEKGIASFGQARRIAELGKWDFIDLLSKEGISLRFDDEEIRKDLEAARKLAEEIAR